MITTNDLPALVAALSERQPRAGWTATGRDHTLASVEHDDDWLVTASISAHDSRTPGRVSIWVCGDLATRLCTLSLASADAVADAICKAISGWAYARHSSLARKQAALQALREATEPRPLDGVTAEGVSRLVNALLPPDGHELKWREVPLSDTSAAELLRHYGHDRRMADVLTAVTGLPARAGDRVEIRGTYAQALRAGEALWALAGIAQGMLEALVKP